MWRVYIYLPFVVPVANVLLDWLLTPRIAWVLTCCQLVSCIGMAKYLSLDRTTQQRRYNRFVLAYFVFILCSLSAAQHLMRGTAAGFAVTYAAHLVLSDFFAVYMVLLRIAAIQPDAHLVFVMRRSFWIVFVGTFILGSIPIILGIVFVVTGTANSAFFLLVYGPWGTIGAFACVSASCLVLCVGMELAVRAPVHDLREALASDTVQGIHRVIVGKALRVARLQQWFALATAISSLFLYGAITIVLLDYIIRGALMDLLQDDITAYAGFYVMGGASLVNRTVNDIAMYVFAFSSGTFVVAPSRRDFDALDQLTAVAAIAHRLLEDAGDDESFYMVEPGGDTHYVSRIEPRPPPPDRYPSVPIWRISRGRVLTAKLSRATKRADGSWVWEDTTCGMEDGVYQYVACYGEEFLRASVDDDHTVVAAGATVLMAGTLEVRGGVLELWTNTSNTFRPLGDLVMQAKLPPDKLWRFCRAGMMPTNGHQIRPLGDGCFLERFMLDTLVPGNPGTLAHASGKCEVCLDFPHDRCEMADSCPRCHHPAHVQDALVAKYISVAKGKRREEDALVDRDAGDAQIRLVERVASSSEATSATIAI